MGKHDGMMGKYDTCRMNKIRYQNLMLLHIVIKILAMLLKKNRTLTTINTVNCFLIKES